MIAAALKGQSAAPQAALHSRGARAWRLGTRRLVWMVPLLVFISVAIFALAWVAPTDSTSSFLSGSEEFVSGSVRSNIDSLMGKDNWLGVWAAWVASALGGDFGWSISNRAPVAEVVLARLPWTVLIMGAGLAVAAITSICLALFIALYPKSAVSRPVISGLWALSALPGFVLSLGLMAIFAIGLGWLPAGGLTNAGSAITVSQVARHMILPTLAVAVSQMPWMTLHLHQSLSAQLLSPAIEAARVRGLTEFQVLTRHALPNALIPVLAIAGARLPEVVAGAALVEEIFSWPGLGQSLIQAALARDFALLTSTGLLLTAMALLGGLLADLALVLLDPRIDAHGL